MHHVNHQTTTRGKPASAHHKLQSCWDNDSQVLCDIMALTTERERFCLMIRYLSTCDDTWYLLYLQLLEPSMTRLACVCCVVVMVVKCWSPLGVLPRLWLTEHLTAAVGSVVRREIHRHKKSVKHLSGEKRSLVTKCSHTGGNPSSYEIITIRLLISEFAFDQFGWKI